MRPGKGMSPEGLYETLFRRFGPQGWWPIPSRAGDPGFDARGYHRDARETVLTDRDRWEISAGAVLTQNAAWSNAEKALRNLSASGVRVPREILELDPDSLRSLIRPSGYYNLKAQRLRALASFLVVKYETPTRSIELKGSVALPPTRDELLAVDGIGPETADSILLYAWKVEQFVVDAYTIRVLTRTGLLTREELPKTSKKRYEHVQKFILTRIIGETIPENLTRTQWFSEFHALFVALCARHCLSSPRCDDCPLELSCEKHL